MTAPFADAIMMVSCESEHTLEERIDELTHVEASLVNQIQALETLAKAIRRALDSHVDPQDQMVVNL